MSDIEHVSFSLPVNVESVNNTTPELSGTPTFDLATFLDRQGVINGILSTKYSTPENQVADLNAHIAGWDDEKGISYTYMVGHYLPGLKVNVPATAIAFAANYAPNADFQYSNLDYGVFSASVMPDAKLRHSSLDHAVMPLLSVSGDARSVSAVKSILNLASVKHLDMSGMDISAAYVLGIQGMDEDKLLSLEDSQEAISTLADAERDEAAVAMLSDGLSRFSGSNQLKDIIKRLRYPQIFTGLNSSGIILRKQLRDRRQGMLLHQVMLGGSEISKYDFEGNIWSDVSADRATAIATHFAGAIILNSSLDNIITRGSYAPGLVAIDSSFHDTALPKNSAGSVYFDCDLTNATVDEVQEAGVVIIGGKPPRIDADRPDIRALTYGDLPEQVLENLQRLQKTTVNPKPVNKSLPSGN